MKTIIKLVWNKKKAIFKAIGDALKFEEAILIQESIKAKEYRVYVLNGIICSVSERVHPYVIGDGEHSIKQLIEIENTTKWRQFIAAYIIMNEPLTDNLKKINLTLESIPEKEERVNLVSSSMNISIGALAKDVTDSVHPSIKKLFYKIYKKLGLLQAGVDFLCEDISKDLKEQKWYILDWNNGDGIRAHQYPQYGPARNVYRAILGAAFPELQSHALYNTQGGPAPNQLIQD